jgi:hypothetical protein
MSKGYTPEGKTEKEYYQPTKKRNLLSPIYPLALKLIGAWDAEAYHS